MTMEFDIICILCGSLINTLIAGLNVALNFLHNCAITQSSSCNGTPMSGRCIATLNGCNVFRPSRCRYNQNYQVNLKMLCLSVGLVGVH